MGKSCRICGKTLAAGRSIARRGLAKKKGGVGKKITGITKRVFRANLKNIKVKINNTVKTISVCTKCIKAGKIEKA